MTSSTWPKDRSVLDYLAVNRAHWDDRAAAHASSRDYEVPDLVAHPDHLSAAVRLDRPRLGDLHGLRVVHLQCHIGTDTVSLSRLGASVTGLDFSGESVRAARELAATTDTTVDFVEAEVYQALEVLEPGSFDLVYTGVGALCWLPDIRRWAGVVAALLRPGGRLLLREAHPMLWALDDASDVLTLTRPYFEVPDALLDFDDRTYVDTPESFTHQARLTWNHGLGEILSALLDHSLRIDEFVEHDTVPWPALPGLMEPVGDGEWRLRERPERLAHSYTVRATLDAG